MRHEWTSQAGSRLYAERGSDGVIDTNAGPDDTEAHEEILRLAERVKHLEAGIDINLSRDARRAEEGAVKLAERVRELEAINGGWQCFHCGVIFRGEEAAEHFGRREDADPPTCISTRHPLVQRLRARIAALEAHLGGIRKLLRSECVDLGDNDWSDDIHLADVVEKHLVRHVRGRIEELEAENAALRENLAALAAACGIDLSMEGERLVANSIQEDRRRVRRELLAEITKAGAIYAQEAFPAEAVAYLERALGRILPEDSCPCCTSAEPAGDPREFYQSWVACGVCGHPAMAHTGAPGCSSATRDTDSSG